MSEEKSKTKNILPVVYTIIGVGMAIFSGVLLSIKYMAVTNITVMLIATAVIGIIWIIQGIVIFKLKKAGTAYVVVATILLLPTAYALLTTHTMTKYIVISGSYESNLTMEEFRNGATMNVTSESLKNGRWDKAIAGTSVGGNNETPQLTFDKVNGADSYVIIMVDESARNWFHWRATNVKQNELKQGEELSEETSKYHGPYPPAGSGDHKYVVYVFALKGNPDTWYLGDFDEAGTEITKKYEMSLDVSSGERGNVLAYGFVEGVYSVD